LVRLLFIDLNKVLRQTNTVFVSIHLLSYTTYVRLIIWLVDQILSNITIHI